MLVSWRQAQRSAPTAPSGGNVTSGGWASAAPLGSGRGVSLVVDISDHRLETVHGALQVPDQVAPGAGHEQDPDGDEQGATELRDQAAVAAHDRERAEG